MAGRRIVVEFLGKDTSLGRTADRVETKTSKIGGKLAAFGRAGALATAGLAVGVGALAKSSSELEQKFSRTMSLVAASTGAPKSAIAGLNALAMKLGAETAFSANEAADAMLELGKAGISTSDIMGGALKGTLLLATAGSTDLGTASTIAANAMNAFSLKGKDMNRIAAALAGGANASTASVASLGQALQQVGPGAVQAGLDLNETVAALSAFDAAGIKGSDAGTSLKTMLARLQPTTFKQIGLMQDLHLNFVKADGSFRSLTEISGQLHKSLSGLSEAERQNTLNTLFGSDASRAASVLMKEGATGIQKYITATKDQTAAQKMAKAAMSGSAGAMERLRGSVETAKLALGQALQPAVTTIANTLSSKVLPAVTKFITGMKAGHGAGGAFAAIIRGLGIVLRPVGEFIGKQLVPFVKDMAKRFVDASGGVSGMHDTMGKLEPTVRLLKAAMGVLWTGIQWAAKTIIPILASQLRRTISTIGALSQAAIWLWNKAFGPSLRFIIQGVAALMMGWSKMLGALGHVPGFDWATRAGDRMGNAAQKAWSLSQGIRDIPPDKKVTITVTERHRLAAGGYGPTYIGPNRARGGPADPRKPFLVGERGPEIFKPSGSGRIIPTGPSARAMSSGGTGSVTINFNGLVTNPKAAAQEVRKVLLDLKRANGGAALGIG